VRPVRRSDERDRDVSGRALPGARSNRDRHLRPRLQPRLPSVLLLQPEVRLPVSPARESSDDSDPRRRENGTIGALMPAANGDANTANRESRSGIRAIVFDFDGVLADSEPLHLRAYQKVLGPIGITMTPHEYYANFLGYDDEGVFTKIAQGHGIRMDVRQITALIEEKTRVFDEMIGAGGGLYPPARACVRG